MKSDLLLFAWLGMIQRSPNGATLARSKLGAMPYCNSNGDLVVVLFGSNASSKQLCANAYGQNLVGKFESNSRVRTIDLMVLMCRSTKPFCACV